MKKTQTRKVVSPCKVVVVDNDDDEASALIRTLSERDTPVLYYKGRKNELPENPITGVRIVFLDMKLEGMERQEPETIVSSLMGLLKKIVSSRNGPYLIFAWTKHDDLLKEFRKQLEERGSDIPKPYFLANMEKNECMIDGKLDYEKVSSKLVEKLSELPVFGFLTKWEKTVGDSRSEVISLISSMVKDSDVKKWRNELGRILYQIAKAHSGKTLEEETERITHSAMNVMNSILKDCIEKRVRLTDEEFLECPACKEISEEIKAIINTRIHVRDLEEAKAVTAPGNLYILENFANLQKYVDYLPADMNSFVKQFLNSTQNLERIATCMLEITPMCDYAQGKWKAARLLIGLIVPMAMKDRIKKSAGFLYQTPLLSLNGNLCYLIFNSYYMTGAQFNKLNNLEPDYQLRIDLLSDIQSKLSSHISRRGVIELR